MDHQQEQQQQAAAASASAEMAQQAQAQEQQAAQYDPEDTEPAFIDASATDQFEEVQVEDGDEPMSDDEDDAGPGYSSAAAGAAAAAATDGTNQPTAAVPDQSIATFKAHAGPAYAVATHFDAATGTLRVVSGGGDDRAFLHTLATGGGGAAPRTTTVPLTHPHTDSVSSVAFNSAYVPPEAKGKSAQHLVAVGSYDGSLALYDAGTGQLVQLLDGPTDVEFVDFHPKGGTVVLAGSISDGTVWMYHTPTMKCLQVFVGHEGGDGQGGGGGGGVSAGTFTPDGKFALSAGMDGTLRIWAPRTGVCRHTFRLAAESGAGDARAGLTCLQVDGGADGQLAVAGSEDGLAYIVHLTGKKIAATLRHYDETPGAAGGSGGGGMDVDGEGQDGGDEELLRSVEAVGFASKAVNPNWVATGGVNGTLKVWDVTHGGHGQCRQVCRPPADEAGGHVAGVTRIKWHPTLPLVLATYTDGATRLWDARDGSLVTTLTGGHAGVMINGMAAEFVGADAPGGGTAVVVTAVDDGGVRVFEINIASAVEAAAQARQNQ
eukprot:CAMPEP_0181057794 /NCGR_PEP_ID=MMETSP1070-20121207/20447_1 /TAXON_ID=265543 /ORGANISM="Minutocellus polymorphus, Strain NH13" /LENGTH=545 /DNA_ID=CAMNT_0023137245 /DNA_START=93 /DNA_END=1730 /DNA_ORIENTATION=-